MDSTWWFSVVAVAATLGLALRIAVLQLPWRRQRNAQLTAVLPFPRDEVWRAWLADKRLLTPGKSFETAVAGDELDIVRSAMGRGDASRMRIAVIACRSAETFAARRLPATPAERAAGLGRACEAILLHDEPAGTRVTLVASAMTRTLLEARGMAAALELEMARIRYELGTARSFARAVLARR